MMCECSYLSEVVPANIPTISENKAGVVYGPLKDFPGEPQLILMWLKPSQAMIYNEVLGCCKWSDSMDSMALGRPACAVIPTTLNKSPFGMSLGCTGMRTFTEVSDDHILATLNCNEIDSFLTNLQTTLSANKEIRKWGTVPQFDFEVKDHIDISENLNLLELERAAKTAGARFYYLMGDLVKLNQSLIQFGLDFLSEKGYTMSQPPYMINRKAMEGAVILDDFEDVIYKIEVLDLYLICTSEHAMVSMYADEILDGNSQPSRYAAISPCFRKEAGAHGKDQKGIFRVHQFEKVEQFAFSKPEDSWKLQLDMLENTKEFYQKLGIPYRVIVLSSGDMGKVSAKTFDIEAWMAGQNTYREIGSISNCLDYQARRLKIRFRDKTNEETRYVHTLNATLVAIERTMVAIMENFQTKDGHIKIPNILQKYMGKKII